MALRPNSARFDAGIRPSTLFQAGDWTADVLGYRGFRGVGSDEQALATATVRVAMS